MSDTTKDASNNFEDMYRFLADSSPNPAVVHVEGIVYYVNDAMISAMGAKDLDDAIGRSVFESIHPDSREFGMLRLQKLAAGEKIETDEYKMLTIQGKEFNVLANSVFFKINGKPAFLTQMTDITELKKKEERIAELAYFSESIVSSAPVGIIAMDNSGKLTSVNDEFLKIVGSPSTQKTMELDVDIRELQETGITAAIKQTLTSGEAFELMKLPYTSRWGVKLMINIKGVPQIAKDGSISGVIIVVDDVTRRVKAEEKNALLESQLRQSQKLETIGTMAGGIAHDFNNILTPILGFTELALAGLHVEDPLIEMLKPIATGANRAKDLVDQILTFSRQKEQSRQPHLLQAIIDEALTLVTHSFPPIIDIKQNISESCGKVIVDPTQIHQVVVNLLTNAQHAMEKTGGELIMELVQVSVDGDLSELYPKLEVGEFALLTITDSGCGIEADIIERIFDPFFTTKDISRGTGLGLSVVHGIVQSHEGEIIVNSSPGIGTTFKIYLPISTSDTKSEDSLPEVATDGNGSVLLVDDEECVTSVMKSMLEYLGYEVEVMNDSLMALDRLRENSPNYDLLITDLNMPGISGLTLAIKLKELSITIPVILMSGFGEAVDIELCDKSGIANVVSKPIHLNELAVSVRRILN
jgi:two-component system, cell cycle sensor histidine kinase and response regulator CckA